MMISQHKISSESIVIKSKFKFNFHISPYSPGMSAHKRRRRTFFSPLANGNDEQSWVELYLFIYSSFSRMKGSPRSGSRREERVMVRISHRGVTELSVTPRQRKLSSTEAFLFLLCSPFSVGAPKDVTAAAAVAVHQSEGTSCRDDHHPSLLCPFYAILFSLSFTWSWSRGRCFGQRNNYRSSRRIFSRSFVSAEKVPQCHRWIK